jgi:hypothetical protein
MHLAVAIRAKRDGVPDGASAQAGRQLRDALKLAMHCYFARDSGVVSALEVMGGVDTEYEIIGRRLWHAPAISKQELRQMIRP